MAILLTDRHRQVRPLPLFVVVEATEDLDLKAGRNINITSQDKILLVSNEANVSATSGNLAKGLGIDLVSQAFAGSFVGPDVILDLIGAASPIKLPFIGG